MFANSLWPSDVSVKLVWNDVPISRDALVGVKAALVDLYLLAETDTIITSSSSTFGYIAHAMR